MSRYLFCVICLQLAAAPGFGQAPELSLARAQPPAPATRVSLTFAGENLSGATEVWTSFGPEAATLWKDGKQIGAHLFFDESPAPAIGVVRLGGANGISGFQFAFLDPLPSIRESEGDDDSRTNAEVLALPIAVDGVCEEAAFDRFKFFAVEGQSITFDLLAQRIGSLLDPFLRLLDERGEEVLAIDDSPGAGRDIRFQHLFAREGMYTLEIRDTRYDGGSKHFYHLRAGDFPLQEYPFAFEQMPGLSAQEESATSVRESEPNDEPAKAVRISLPAQLAGGFHREGDRDLFLFEAGEGQRWVFAGATRSRGSPCDLFLQISNADGAVLARSNPTDPGDGELTHTFKEAGCYRLMVEELTGQSGPEMKYWIDVRRFKPGFGLTVEAERIQATPGEAVELKVSVSRRDYSGPIELALEGLDGPVELADATVPEKKNEATLKITLAETGAWNPGSIRHFRVVGKAKIGDEEFQARASTSPALRNLFPALLHPPVELDGWIGLGVKTKRPETKKSSKDAGSG